MPIRARICSLRFAGSKPSTSTVPLERGAVALQDLDGGRLARAVRAEQGEYLALFDFEADALDGLELAIRLAQLIDDDRGHDLRAYSAAESATEN